MLQSSVIVTSSSWSSIKRTIEITPSSDTFLVEEGEIAGFFRSKAHWTKVDFPTPVAPKTAKVISCIAVVILVYTLSVVRPDSKFALKATFRKAHLV